jgi:hypothetical protein
MRKQSNFGRLKMFICLTYIHVLEDKITKLQAQTKKCLLTSYNGNSKCITVMTQQPRRLW